MSLQIEQRLLPGDHTPGRAGHPIEAIVLHVTDGTSIEGALDWWARPEINASTHYLVGQDGRIVQAVREENTAWGNGLVQRPDTTNPLIASWVSTGVNPNRRTISIERVGRPGATIPAIQWEQLTALIANIAARYRRIQVDRLHIIGHCQIDGVDRAACPSLTDSQWSRLLADVRALMAPPATSWTVGPGLLAAITAAGERPMSHEQYVVTAQGQHSRVYTDRAVWEYQADDDGGNERIYRAGQLWRPNT